MGPVMSARNIALLRSHWTSTILPISVSQTQRSAGLLFGAAHGVFGSCHVRPLSDRQFPELPFPTIYMLFRPEQKHGLSGKDNVLVPIAGRNGYMD